MGKYVIRPEKMPEYTPPGHQGTVNRPLITKDTVGAKHMEIVLGTVAPTGLTEAHAHEIEEQALYFTRGRAIVDVEGEKEEVKAGDLAFFPPGKSHKISPVGKDGYQALVIYAPHRSRGG